MSSNSVSDGSVTKRSFGLPSISLRVHQDTQVPSVFVRAELNIVNRKFIRSSIIDDKVPNHSLPPLRENISRVKTTACPQIFVPGPHRPDPDPKVYLDEAWGMVKPAIGIIFNDEPENFNCTEIFNAVRKAWWAKSSGEALYKLILEECGRHISAAIQSLEGHCNDDPSVFLPLMEKCWFDFERRMWVLCSIAGCEGRRPDGRTLWEFGLELFPTRLCLANNVVEKVLSSILLFITDQRLSKTVDMSQLEKLMDMFSAEYFFDSSFFEKRFVQCAAEFYAAESLQVMEQSDFPQYLKHVEQRLREEKEKCNRPYFFIVFEELLIKVVEKELLSVHASSILEKDFAKLMDESCEDDLQRLYNLFYKADLLNHLKDALRSYILKTGKNILRLEGSSSLAKFKASVDKIWFSYFLEDASLEKTVEHSFTDLGLLPCKVSEYPLFSLLVPQFF